MAQRPSTLGHTMHLRLLASVFALIALPTWAAGEASYFPPRNDWARCAPADCGMDAKKLAEAVAFAEANENPAPRDQTLAWLKSFGQNEPYFGGILGPMAERGGVNGLIIHRGKVVAEFGDTQRADISNSVTKSFLSAVVGLAWQDGRIRSTDARVAESMPTGVDLFASPKNAPITWQHLLQQTSDWEGTLWGKPDWADRPVGATPADWPTVPRHAPGSVYEYNDVRINVLALSALHVWREPLPVVLRERLMDPIGASNTWRWEGYANSWIELDGQRMQSVSGGGHWGGGLFISAWDMARVGLLYLHDGEWNGQRLIANEWIAKSRAPGSANANYGYANWFLNTGRKELPSAPESAYFFAGNGQNIIYIDEQNDLVVVVRWIANGPALNGFIERVLAAKKP